MAVLAWWGLTSCSSKICKPLLPFSPLPWFCHLREINSFLLGDVVAEKRTEGKEQAQTPNQTDAPLWPTLPNTTTIT